MTTLIKKTTYEIDKPLQMIKMANILKAHIVKNNLYMPIVGKNYVLVEGWQFAGGMMGLFPKVVEVKEIKEGKWMAHVEIINQKTKEIVSSGYAICSKTEGKKSSFDEYAILSMAQTRAIGKAYRNLIGWVIKFAGYEAVPAEEMKGKAGATDAKPEENKAEKLFASEAEKERIKQIGKELGCATIGDIEKETGLRISSWKDLTKVQASKILFLLMEKKAKK